MSKVLAKWVRRMLTNDQKRTRLYIYSYLLARYEDDPGDFIEQVVTQDETLVNHFDQELKMQSKNGSTLAHPEILEGYSAGKVMASIFWDS